jgi:hypothetical protein
MMNIVMMIKSMNGDIGTMTTTMNVAGK